MDVTIEELKSRLQYDAETGLIFWKAGNRRAGKEAFTTVSVRGYKATTFRSLHGSVTTLAAHRAAWAIHYGEFPSGSIDHINGNKLDNRIANLRDVTSAENARNSAMSRANKSGVTGVYLHKQTGKWCAQISAFGKHVGLGLFSTQSDAIIARKAAERVLGYHQNHGRQNP
jgi:hypothetical protein